MFVVEMSIKPIENRVMHDKYNKKLKQMGVYFYTDSDILKDNSNIFLYSCATIQGVSNMMTIQNPFKSKIYKVENLFEINTNAIKVFKLDSHDPKLFPFFGRYGHYWYEIFNNTDRNERFFVSVDEKIKGMKNPFEFKSLLCVDKEIEKKVVIRDELYMNYVLAQF